MGAGHGGSLGCMLVPERMWVAGEGVHKAVLAAAAGVWCRGWVVEGVLLVHAESHRPTWLRNG